MREQLEAGQMIFVADGQVGVGAIREVRSDESTLLINIENAGDFVVPISAIGDVHSGKAILDMAQLDPDVREALKHVHESEDPTYAALDEQDGVPDVPDE